MPRIRSLHAEQWTDDAFVTCSPLARLLALGTRNYTDDNGIFDWNPVKLKMRVLPADNCDTAALLEELANTNQIYRYTVEGREFGIIRNFHRFQRPKKPSYTFPRPPMPLPPGYELASDIAADSPTGGELVENRSGNPAPEVVVVGKVEEGKGEEKQEPRAPAAASSAMPPVLANTPYEKLIALYHEALPDLPRCMVLSEARKRHIRARWEFWRGEAKYTTVPEGLVWWQRFFRHVGESDFLIGQVEARDGRPPFVADIDFIMNPEKNVRIFEGKYHETAAA